MESIEPVKIDTRQSASFRKAELYKPEIEFQIQGLRCEKEGLTDAAQQILGNNKLKLTIQLASQIQQLKRLEAMISDNPISQEPIYIAKRSKYRAANMLNPEGKVDIEPKGRNHLLPYLGGPECRIKLKDSVYEKQPHSGRYFSTNKLMYDFYNFVCGKFVELLSQEGEEQRYIEQLDKYNKQLIGIKREIAKLQNNIG